MRKTLLSGAAFPLTVLLAVSGASAQTDIGVAAAITNRVSGNYGGEVRSLGRGDDVFQDETIDTETESTAQLLFLDETTLTIGPSSSVVLNSFVYDPSTNSGELVLDATKGAFRFISGSAPSESYEIRTPAATLGVRGTVFEFYIDEAGNLLLMLIEGAVEIGVQPPFLFDQPGYYVTVGPDGQIEGPFKWDDSLRQRVQSVTFPLIVQGDSPDDWISFKTIDDLIDYLGLNDALDQTDVGSDENIDNRGGGGNDGGGGIGGGGGY